MLSLSNKLSLTTQPIYRFVNEHSVDFDGVDDRIITDGADTVAQPTTYSFWCKSSETGQNQGVFGHGNTNVGAFHFNAFGGNRPILYLENNYYRYWTDTPAQDDGEWHHWVVYSDTNDITNSKLYVDGVLQTVDATVSSGSTNAYTESLTIGSDRQSGGNSFVGKIDEFAVYDRELTQAEITRMYNTYYSPNRIANGNFAQEGVEEVTNGDFATDSDWTFQSSWSISGGKANYDAVTTQHYLKQTMSSIAVGKTVKVQFDILDVEAGKNAFFKLECSGDPETIFAYTTFSEGTYTYYHTITTAFDRLNFVPLNTSTGGSFSIDNISVKEVGQHWTFGTGWSIENGKAVCSSLSNNLTQDYGVIANKDYKVTVEVTDYTSGTLYVDLGGASAQTTSSLGNKTFYFTTSSTALLRFYGGAFRGSIDNIVVQELKHDATNLMLNAGDYQAASDLQNYYRMGDGIFDGYPLIADQTNPSLGSELVTNGDFSTDSDWTKGTGWTIASGLASCDGTNTGVSNLQTTVGLSGIQNKQVKFSFDITNYQAGTIIVTIEGTGGNEFSNLNSNGTYTTYISSSDSLPKILFKANAGFIGSIDNVSVKQVNGNPGSMTNMSASDIVLDTPNEPN